MIVDTLLAKVIGTANAIDTAAGRDQVQLACRSLTTTGRGSHTPELGCLAMPRAAGFRHS